MAEDNPLFQTDFGKSLLSPSAPAQQPSSKGGDENPLLQTDYMKGANAPSPAPSDQKMAQGPAPELSLSDAAMQGVKNLPSSAYKFGENIVTPIMHPIETLENVGQIGTGLYSKAAGVFTNQDAAKKAQDEAAVNAIGKMYADRYGSWSGFKQALASDPVSILADAASVLTGGETALGSVPGAIGTTAKAVGTVGRAIDPLSIAAKGVKTAAQAASYPVNAGLWLRTGSSFPSLQAAADAGFAGNKTFLQGLNGSLTGEDAVNRVKNLVSDMIQEKNDAYSKGASARALNTTQMDFNPILQSWSNADPRFTGQGYALPVNNVAKDAWEKAGNVIQDYLDASNLEKSASNPQNTIATPMGFDKLKQALWNVQKEYQYDKEAASTVSNIRNSVKDEISKVDPQYASDMDAYQNAQSTINDMTKQFSLGRNVAVGTTLKKLLKEQASDKKSNFFDHLNTKDPDLVPLLAGIEMNESMPQGLRGQLNQVLNYGTIGGAAAGLIHPAFLANIAMSSPKVAGMMNYGAGYAAGLPSRSLEKIPYFARMAPYYAGEAENADRAQRKSGGRVSHETRADQLIAAAERSKKSQSNATEVLLDQPDEAITRALSIAKQHI